ncbi:MAG: ABC transporter permease [bacterium]
MFKSLLWKEWRENRTIILGALCSILGLSLIFYLALRKIGDASALVILYIWLGHILIPTIAAGITANMFSREKNKSDLEYLFSLPVSKSKIWWTKIAIGIGTSLLFCCILSILLASITNFEHKEDYFPLVAILSLAMMMIAFSVSTLTSVIGTRSGTATFYGVAMAIGSYLSSVFVVKHIDIPMIYIFNKHLGIPDFVLIFLMIACGLTIICSFISYFRFGR